MIIKLQKIQNQDPIEYFINKKFNNPILEKGCFICNICSNFPTDIKWGIDEDYQEGIFSEYLIEYTKKYGKHTSSTIFICKDCYSIFNNEYPRDFASTIKLNAEFLIRKYIEKIRKTRKRTSGLFVGGHIDISNLLPLDLFLICFIYSNIIGKSRDEIINLYKGMQ